MATAYMGFDYAGEGATLKVGEVVSVQQSLETGWTLVTTFDGTSNIGADHSFGLSSIMIVNRCGGNVLGKNKRHPHQSRSFPLRLSWRRKQIFFS